MTRWKSTRTGTAGHLQKVFPHGGVSEFAGQLCETIGRTAGKIAVITDRDNCVAVTGAPRREIQDKQISLSWSG